VDSHRREVEMDFLEMLPNPAHALDCAVTSWFHAECHLRAASDAQRYAHVL